jgi:hypothetical protein
MIDLSITNSIMNEEQFLSIFSHIPLDEDDKNKIKDYYKIYEGFINSVIDPNTAWICTRNIFAIKEGNKILEKYKKL